VHNNYLNNFYLDYKIKASNRNIIEMILTVIQMHARFF